MLIQCDQEGSQVLNQLADLALKGSGLAAHNVVSQLVQTARMVKVPEVQEVPASEVPGSAEAREINFPGTQK